MPLGETLPHTGRSRRGEISTDLRQLGGQLAGHSAPARSKSYAIGGLISSAAALGSVCAGFMGPGRGRTAGTFTAELAVDGSACCSHQPFGVGRVGRGFGGSLYQADRPNLVGAGRLHHS
jgi:hypothetical protein